MSDREILLLRLGGPLMSFGAVKVDEHNVTGSFPRLSMLTGLLANALGWDHADCARLQRLQNRLRLAARCDRAGSRIIDFQTVDLGQDFLKETWTTSGSPERRTGGTAKEGTHIRYRHYVADAVYTVALFLEPPEESPTLQQLEEALASPERPLFLGRKCCPPTLPLILGRRRAPSLRSALEEVALDPRADASADAVPACWPASEAVGNARGREVPVSDLRDWANQVHTGRRFVWAGIITVTAEPAHERH
jgi:CRISPR system Cascade subunit CasD